MGTLTGECLSNFWTFLCCKKPSRSNSRILWVLTMSESKLEWKLKVAAEQFWSTSTAFNLLILTISSIESIVAVMPLQLVLIA